MSSSKLNEKSKVTILLAAVAGVGVLIYMRYQSFTSQPAPQQVVASMQEEGGLPQVIAASNERPEVVITPSSLGSPVNPFRQVVSEPRAPTAVASHQPSEFRPTPMRSEIGGEVPVLPVVADELAPSSLRTASTGTPVRLRLTGVIGGGDPIAVLSDGSTTHMARVGERVVPGVRVVSIGQDSAVVSYAGRKEKLVIQ